MNPFQSPANPACFKPKVLVAAIQKALPYLIALSVAAMASPAAGRSGESSASFVATQLIRQFTLKNTVAQVSQGMQGHVQDVNGKPRAKEMGATPTGYPAGMGAVPSGVNLPQRDGAGRPLGYCAWDNNASVSTVSYLAGFGLSNPLLYAVVSPGLNGNMETTCNDILTLGRGVGDDHVQTIAPGMTSSAQYRTAVATYAELMATAGQQGDVRLVLENNRMYSHANGSWQAVGGAGNFADDSASNGTGAIAYTAGKITVADFQASTVGISGGLSGSTATFTGGVAASAFTGNGAGLTDLNASNINSGVLGTAVGGTGVNASAAAPGSLLIGTGSGFALGSLGAGNGIAVMTGAGSLMISNTGVLSIAGTANQVIASSSNGNIVLSLPQSIATTSTPTFAGAVLNGNMDVMSISQAGVPASLAFRYASDTGSGTYNQPNIALGLGALAGRKGAGNVAVGDGVLGLMSDFTAGSHSGTQNTGVGYQALYSNNGGDENTAIGYRSLYNNTYGFENTAVGTEAMYANTTGEENTAIGRVSLFSNTTGYENTAVGDSSLFSNTTGYQNTAAGQRSLYSNTTGAENTAVGEESLTSNTTGSFNAAFGDTALHSNTVGIDNSAFGKSSMRMNTSGSGNTAVGRDAMRLSTLGNDNTALGKTSLFNNSTGARNVALGNVALASNTTGNDNIGIGFLAGAGVASGKYNISIGSNTLSSATDPGYSTVLGTGSNVLNTGVLYATGIGAYSRVGSSNTVVLGALGVNKSALGYTGYVPADDQVVIGATSAATSGLLQNKILQVTGDVGISSNLAVGGTVTATGFSGNGSGLTDLNASNINSGVLAAAFGGTGVNASAAANGQLLIGNGSGFTLANLLGTPNQINVSNSAGSIALSLPQDISTTSTPTFAGVIVNGNLDVDSLSQAGVPVSMAFEYASDTGSPAYPEPNMAIGTGALAGRKNAGNVAIGAGVLGQMTNQNFGDVSGTRNTGVGYQALYSNDYGGENTALGYQSLYSNFSGYYSSAMGAFALSSNTTGTSNTAVGRRAMSSNIDGSYNTAVGEGAMRDNTSGYANTAVGQWSLRNNQTGYQNTATGEESLMYNNTGSFNSAFGKSALRNTTAGAANSAFGRAALELNTTGSENTAMGNLALATNTVGTNNTAIGTFALDALASGSRNVALGSEAGSKTTGLGYRLLNGSDNTFLGDSTGPAFGISSLDFATAIGAQAEVATSNTIVLGRTIDNIVLGATSDDGSGNKLQVNGGLKATGNVFLNTGSNTNYTQLRDLRVMSSFDNAPWDHLRIQTLGGVTKIDAGGAEDGLLFRVGNTNSGNVGEQAYNTVLTLKADRSAVFEGRVDVQSLFVNGQAVSGGSGSTSLESVNTAVTIASSIGAATPQTNLALGQFALSGQARAANVAIGEGVLANLVASADNSHGTFNTGVGFYALNQTTTGSYNTGLGAQALMLNTTGRENTAVGNGSMVLNTTGNRNVSVGSNSMRDNLSGSQNIAVGTNALFKNTTGSENTAVGDNALFNNMGGQNNSALGATALFLNTSGFENTAMGKNALYGNTTGYHNSAVGFNSLFSNSTGYNNAALGRSALQNSSTGINNTAMGAFALFNTTVANDNTAVGLNALFFNTTGSANLALGMGSLQANTTGRYNLGVGTGSDVASNNLVYASAIGNHARVGSSNTLVLGALGSNKNAAHSTTDDQVVIGTTTRNDTYANTKLHVVGNTFISGDLVAGNATFTGALTFNGTPNFSGGIEIPTNQKLRFGPDLDNTDSQYFERQNMAYNQTVTRFILGDDSTQFGHFEADEFQVGYLAGNVNYTPVFRIAGSGDVIVKGYVSASHLLVGNSLGGVTEPNMAIGNGAMGGIPSGFGANTAVGVNALAVNTSGDKNTALGTYALAANTTGIRNTGLGFGALKFNVSGFENTAVGDGAGFFTTGSKNTIVGQAALFYNTGGSENVVVGRTAMFNNQTGSSNIAVGMEALIGNTSGNSSVAIGNYSLASLSSGGNNIAIGNQSGQPLASGSRNIFIGELVGQFTTSGSNNIGIGHQVKITNNISHAVAIGNDAEVTTSSTVVLGRTGDRVVIGATGTDGSGDKLQVSGAVRATAFNVSSDRRLKTDIQLQNADSVLERLEQLQTYSYEYISSPGVGRRIGVIAQEIQNIFPEAVATRPDSIMSVDYNALGAMAAMGVGRLNTQFKQLNSTVSEQGAKIALLDERTDLHNTRLVSLEGWRTAASQKMDVMQNAIDLNIQKIAENTVAIQTNTDAIVRLDDALVNLDGRVKTNAEWINNINARWAKNFTESADGSVLAVNAVELKVSNFTAQQVRANSVHALRLEAEMARIADLEVNNLRANSAVANVVQAEQMNTGSVQVYAGAGLPAILFAAKSDGHYTVSTSSLDGSYATATVIVNAGQAKVVSGSSEGIELYAEGNVVKAVAAGKTIKASWIKMG